MRLKRSDRLSVVLLPGLDGKGDYLKGLRDRLVKDGYACDIIPYPENQPLGYDELRDYVTERIKDRNNVVVLGDSFGGPLALMVANALGDRAKGVILSATFTSRPMPKALLNAGQTLGPRLLKQKPLNQAIAVFLVNLFAGNLQDAGLSKAIYEGLKNSGSETVNRRLQAIKELNSVDLEKFSLPCLVLDPRQDLLLPLNKKTRYDDIPNKVVHSIPGPHQGGLMKFLR